MNAFYAGVLLTLVLGVTTLKIDSSSILVPSEHPSNRIAADFFPRGLRSKVKQLNIGNSRHLPCQLDEGSGHDVTVISTLQLTLVRAASTPDRD